MEIVDSISEKNMKATLSLSAGRGRGKSAALGVALAGAIVYGFSNVIVTAPSPENLGTLFEFVLNGLAALNYKEH
jgi:N-acetyltransferase 10